MIIPFPQKQRRKINVADMIIDQFEDHRRIDDGVTHHVIETAQILEDALNRLRNECDDLRAENERLKNGGRGA